VAAEPEWAEVERLFDAALDHPPADRLAWLATATRDPELRALVARMLAAHATEGPLDRLLDVSPLSIRARLEAALDDRYEIDEEIGHGGMATVYRARERKHERPVVLKVLKPETAVAFGAERFLAEIHVAAQLSHPHILALLDSGEADGLLYYVMPWLGGETLRTRLRRERRLPVATGCRILRDLADALASAHRAGVVHRDLKPENILLVGDHAYLLDFGIAQLRVTDTADRVTGEGTVVGTMGYMAPEQEAGVHTDHRADLFALGVVGRELLTGMEPGLFTSILPETLPPETPAALGALLQRCLEPDPAARPADMDEVLATLTPLVRPDLQRPVPLPRRRRTVPLLLLGVGLLAGAAWWTLGRRPAPVPLGSLPLPVAVAPLENETGDTSLAVWGRMAGDWITQGLQETGTLTVIPWPNAREAAGRRTAGGDQVRLMREETGAGTVITGSYYRVGDRLRFQAQITDAVRGTLLAYPEPVETSRDSVAEGLRLLRGRVMGALAIRQDERVAAIPGLAERPPTFDAYREFDRGLELHDAQRYGEAVTAFRQAFALDSTFGVALFSAAVDLWNTDDYVAVDSVVTLLGSRRLQLTEYHQLQVGYLRALLDGDGERAYALARRAAELTGDTRGLNAVAWIANGTNRPAAALAALQRIDPDAGSVRRWAPYWIQRAHAEHRVGRFVTERESARQMQQRHPESRIALVLEVRAAAAQGDTRALDSLLTVAGGLSPDSYWSEGAALVVAGEELNAHGRGFASPAYFRRAVRWLANQLARDPHHRAHRYWMGTALYDAGQWQSAEPYFASLAADFPERLQYRGLQALVLARAGRAAAAEQRLGPRPRFTPAEHTLYRARLAAIAGRRENAISLLAQAVAEGYESLPWLHAVAFRDFGGLVGDPRYATLMQPDTAP
jgi:tetratricopeptide (TPR) repeat protein